MQTKKWYQSKTIWGIVIAAFGFMLNHFLQVDMELPENADLSTIQEHIDGVKNAGSNLSAILSEVLAFAGTIFAIYGRVKADTTIQ